MGLIRSPREALGQGIPSDSPRIHAEDGESRPGPLADFKHGLAVVPGSVIRIARRSIDLATDLDPDAIVPGDVLRPASSCRTLAAADIEDGRPSAHALTVMEWRHQVPWSGSRPRPGFDPVDERPIGVLLDREFAARAGCPGRRSTGSMGRKMASHVEDCDGESATIDEGKMRFIGTYLG